MKELARIASLSLALLAIGGCTLTDTATEFNGLTDHEGKAVTHVNQTKIGLNFFFTYMPLLGDASLNANVADISAEAKADGNKSMRIVQSNDSLWWWIFPPFSFILTPHWSNVAADLSKE